MVCCREMPPDGSWLFGRIVAAGGARRHGRHHRELAGATCKYAFGIPTLSGTLRERTNSPSSHSVSSGYIDSSDMASPLLIMRTELFECGDERIRRLGKNQLLPSQTL